jgi:hypothetical protein
MFALQGAGVTAGLRRVTDDMKAKNRADRSGAVPAAVSSGGSTGGAARPAAAAAAAPTKPPRCVEAHVLLYVTRCIYSRFEASNRLIGHSLSNVCVLVSPAVLHACSPLLLPLLASSLHTS